MYLLFYSGTAKPVVNESSNESSASTSAKEFPHPESDIYIDLKQQLDINLENIQYKYALYVSSIRRSLQEKMISGEELRAHLLNMPVFLEDHGTRQLKLFSGRASKFEKASSINDIFEILSLECCSFVDFGIFKSIVKYFELDKGQEVFRYSEHVDDYLKRHKIKEFVMINPALGKLNEDSEKLVLKFDISMTTELGKVMNLKAAVAKILGLQASALQLLDIKEGCVVVTFLIPKLVSQSLFSGNEDAFTKECISELQALSVVWLRFKDTDIGVTKVISKNQDTMPGQACLSRPAGTAHPNLPKLSSGHTRSNQWSGNIDVAKIVCESHEGSVSYSGISVQGN